MRFSLPDKDVFAIDATATPPAEIAAFSGVGTILFDMAVNPASGKVYVSNSDAHNEVRFEGPGVFGGSTVRGHLHEARITVLDGASVLPRHVNKHIDYGVVPSPAGVSDRSLATPLGMAVTSDGATLYVAAFGSSKVGVFDTAALEDDTFVPDSANHIVVSGGGPSGLVLDEPRGRLYVLTRFDDAVSVVSTATRAEVQHARLHNPEPPSITNGRRFLYDASLTSSNGEAACASCHVFGEFDSLAWDLGNPDDPVVPDPNPQLQLNGSIVLGGGTFHPLKGPMTTQTLRGLAHDGQMHWRGDRTPGTDPQTDPDYEGGSFRKFNVAFNGLLGRSGPLTTAEMQAFTDFVLQIAPPPNPIRALDRSFTPDQQAGLAIFNGPNTDFFGNCALCHALGGGTAPVNVAEVGQHFKVPPLRNDYSKVGMFGMPQVSVIQPGDNGFKGDQVRGFGFLHDGSIDTLFRFHGEIVFNLDDTQRAQLESLVLAIDSTFAPIVGQQVTLGSTNGAAVGPRIDLLLARAGANECDVVVKGTLAGLQRGWVRTAAGTFRSDRAAEPLLSDTQLRAQAATAGQERTYTAVPPGSGQRLGIDRDEDGFLDRDELDAGSDPEDPGSPVPTTTTTSPPPTTTTTTLPFTFIETTAFTVKDGVPGAVKLSFHSSTRNTPAANRIVPAPPGSPADPRIRQRLNLTLVNPMTHEQVNLAIDGFWSLIGSPTSFKGYRFSASAPLTKATLQRDKFVVKMLFPGFTLDEPSQGRLGLAIFPSPQPPALYAEAAAKALGNPPSTAATDHPGRFLAQPHSPPPVAASL